MVEGSATSAMQHTKEGRVIVRNLSYRAMKPDLQKAMSRFGKIAEIVLGEKPHNKPNWPFPHGGFAFVQFSTRKEADKAVAVSSSSQGLKVRGRQVAVDLSVDTRTYAKKKRERRQKEVEEAKKEEEKEEVEEEMKEEPQDLDDDNSDAGEESEESDSEEEDEEPSSSKAKRKCGFDLDEGRTLFIRNLPFTCTIPDVVTSLTEQLNADGDKVKDPVTFVKFVGGGEHPSSGKAFVKMRSSEVADRLLDIEESANRVASAVEKKSQADSKKNLHLLKEGYIDPESEEFLKLTASEKRLREASWKERKYKMYNNTNFVINPLRLSIRNLAVHTTKQSLKQAIDEALKEAKVKASTRHSVKVNVLVDEERRVPIPGGEEGATTKRCKGFAFADFRNNQVALKCLRMMNNNNKYLDSDRRPIVEFAIEDKRALKQLQQSKKKQIEKKKETEVQKDIEKSHKGGRGARQRAARRRRAEEMVAADASDEVAEKVEPAKAVDETSATPAGNGSPRKKLGPAARRRARRREEKEEKTKKVVSSDLAEDRDELERLAQAVANSRQDNTENAEFPSRVRRRSGKKREADKLLEAEQRYLSKVRRSQE
ncbi:myosin heavy chain, clone, putative [Perkinsus marinus ATCC 50983]|uniref:Myosin heavy chain, clone, putative n=1 Tax=Perkinsus marinus (strain ATCC 50983 / TXsc) TaxID=423536 RepID=C5LH89_PERM5|nr:myosin heavy chain, clone, putative [Perkinsus marinus ATCC 50983]EER03898.1 myosin heavy chain, clone, putative [Perkinsus marinus ATCC 50983]|eukprot:XP_002772082.1 myosin heavy chain, clone, putative [Perkinsus marinus ATCC 50983]